MFNRVAKFMAVGCVLVVSSWSPAGAVNTTPVGGGSTKTGFRGEYFANTDFAGKPAFTRRDVRINFDWKEGAAGRGLPVGGATTPGMTDFPLDNFSIRWVGQLVPRFTETYTLRITGKDGVRFSLGGKTLVDSLGAGVVKEIEIPLKAGEKVDVVFEYVDKADTKASVARLEWSSPSTPWEVVDPLSVAQICGHQADTGYLSGDRADIKRDSGSWKGLVANDVKQGKKLTEAELDENGWPKIPGFLIELNRQYLGRYMVRFSGKANVEVGSYWHGSGAPVSWAASAEGPGGAYNKTNSRGAYGMAMLPKGVGYSEKDNTTTAWFDMTGDVAGLILLFTDAEQAPGKPGINQLQVMSPIHAGSLEPHQLGEIRKREARVLFDNFVIDRLHIGMSCSPGYTWQERTLPGYHAREHAMGWGYCLEEYIMMVNEGGMDWHLCYGGGWDEDYMRKFAQMIRYGSDGVNPYDHYVENPKYPPLNSNLRIYLEHANELPWAVFPYFVWEDLKKKARENHPDWKIITYDGKISHDGTGNGYGYEGMYRYHALRMKQMSDAFRQAYADVPDAMGDRARVLCFSRYDSPEMNTMLQFLDNYFNNGDGRQNVKDPHPPSYYIWGGGGAIYYGCDNKFGLTKKEELTNGGFEECKVSRGTAALRPTDSGWVFSGNAGICDVRLPRQPAVSVSKLPAAPAKPLAREQWAGFKFTVGAKDLYVYQLGRWVTQGNKDVHGLSIFAEGGAQIVGNNLELSSQKRDAFAYTWCTVSSAGHIRAVPAYLQAGKTYYLVSMEKAGNEADRFFPADKPLKTAPGLTLQASVTSLDGKTWQETPGSCGFGPVNMIFTDCILSNAEGVVGQPPDSSEYTYDFKLGTKVSFLNGQSTMKREFDVAESGAYWITFNLSVDRPSNKFAPQWWGGWTVNQGGESIRVLVDGVDQTPKLIPQGGFSYQMHAFHYAATRVFRLEPGKHTVAFERVNHGGGTVYIDEIHLSSEAAFYGGPTAPNFPAGGSALGQNAATGYHRTAQAECDMARNWGLVPCTYEGGWAVQADFDHYSMLAWNDLRYGTLATNPELTKQALRNAFDIWCRMGGYTYAYFYPVVPNVAVTNAPLLLCVKEFNDRLRVEPTNGTSIPAALTCAQDHYQNNVDDDYYGFNAIKPKAGPLMKAGFWKSWVIISGVTADYELLVEATPGGAYAIEVDGVRLASGTTGDASQKPVAIHLTKGQHSVRVRCSSGLFMLQQVTVNKVGEPLPKSAVGQETLSFPAKPADAAIDLRQACNRDLVDDDTPGAARGWAAFDSASCIKDLKPGKTDFGYKLVAFDIIDRVANGKKACLVLSGPQRMDVFPKKSAAILVGRKAAALYFLHTAMCVTGDKGESLVRYRIAYEGAKDVIFDCRNLEELGDWWGLPNLPGGMAVHSERSRCLMMTPWKNPNSDKVIKSITMESTGKAIPILLAITASDTLIEYNLIRQILQ